MVLYQNEEINEFKIDDIEHTETTYFTIFFSKEKNKFFKKVTRYHEKSEYFDEYEEYEAHNHPDTLIKEINAFELLAFMLSNRIYFNKSSIEFVANKTRIDISDPGEAILFLEKQKLSKLAFKDIDRENMIRYCV